MTSIAPPETVTWAELRIGDVIASRNGGLWRVDRWETTAGTRWLAAGGGKRERLFTISPVDGSRPAITATHNLSDQVARVFTFDRTGEAAALTALSDAFGEVSMISEGEPMTTTEPRVAPATCAHPDNEHSKLKDGRIFCAACFTTIGDSTDPVADDGLAYAAGLGTPVGAARGMSEAERADVTRYANDVASVMPDPNPAELPAAVHCVDSSGTEYHVPADMVEQACAAGIHPVGTIEWSGEVMSGCGRCGLVFPAPVQSAPAPPAPAPEPVAPAVVTERPTAPAAPSEDAFSDPAAFVEVKRDRWGRYVLPHPETGEEQPWVRVSTLSRAMADEYNLTGWKLRQVARGVALNEDLIAGTVAADPDDKKTLDGLVSKAMERAESSAGANLGTAVHSFTQRLDRGEALASLRAPKSIEPHLIEYRATLNRHGLAIVPELIERIVVVPELGVAGTFDRIVQQRPGYASSCPLTMLDLKTGKSLEYGWGEIAIQQACYNHASWMWDATTRQWIRMPPPEVLDRDRGLILHLPVRLADGEPVRGDLYAVNTIEGWDAAKLGEQVRQFRNSSKGLGWLVTPADPEALLIHRVSQADGPELARLWEKHYAKGEWTQAVQNAAELRVARLTVVPVQ